MRNQGFCHLLNESLRLDSYSMKKARKFSRQKGYQVSDECYLRYLDFFNPEISSYLTVNFIALLNSSFSKICFLICITISSLIITKNLHKKLVSVKCVVLLITFHICSLSWNRQVHISFLRGCFDLIFLFQNSL
jgi:hypothetical protein